MPLATPGPTGRRFAAQTPPKACLEISRKARYVMYNAEEARNAYRFWLNSAPFDCGMTVSSGLREGCCQTEVNRVQVYSVTKKLPCPTVLHRQHQSPRKPLRREGSSRRKGARESNWPMTWTGLRTPTTHFVKETLEAFKYRR
jgi:hypothetical protein